MDVSRADNYVKQLQIVPVSYHKPFLYNIMAHTKFGENPFISSYCPETCNKSIKG